MHQIKTFLNALICFFCNKHKFPHLFLKWKLMHTFYLSWVREGWVKGDDIPLPS